MDVPARVTAAYRASPEHWRELLKDAAMREEYDRGTTNGYLKQFGHYKGHGPAWEAWTWAEQHEPDPFTYEYEVPGGRGAPSPGMAEMGARWGPPPKKTVTAVRWRRRG